MNDKYGADYNAHNLPEGYNSTRGLGKIAPQGGNHLKDVLIPNGKLGPSGIADSPLMYNEYVVYSRDQVVCRYIVHVKFHFK